MSSDALLALSESPYLLWTTVMGGEGGTRKGPAQGSAHSRTAGSMDAIPREHPLSPQQLACPSLPRGGEGREPDFSVEKINVGAKREHLGSALGTECEVGSAGADGTAPALMSAPRVWPQPR